MPPLADNASLPPASAAASAGKHEHRADRRVRAGLSQPAPRQRQRPPHEPFILFAESHSSDFTSLPSPTHRRIRCLVEVDLDGLSL
jgi:hypothetical protein